MVAACALCFIVSFSALFEGFSGVPNSSAERLRNLLNCVRESVLYQLSALCKGCCILKYLQYLPRILCLPPISCLPPAWSPLATPVPNKFTNLSALCISPLPSSSYLRFRGGHCGGVRRCRFMEREEAPDYRNNVHDREVMPHCQA